MDIVKILKGAWFWQDEWWFIIAINMVIKFKLEAFPEITTSLTIHSVEINSMLNIIAGSRKKRIRTFLRCPIWASIMSSRIREIILEA